jgi:hypothetical protein
MNSPQAKLHLQLGNGLNARICRLIAIKLADFFDIL